MVEEISEENDNNFLAGRMIGEQGFKVGHNEDRTLYEEGREEGIPDEESSGSNNSMPPDSGDINDIDFDGNKERCNLSHTSRLMKSLVGLFCTNLIPDDLTHVGSMQIFESIEAVRILKFIIVTTVLIIVVHFSVRGLNWEHDVYYSLGNFFHYDFVTAVLYSVVFAMIARIGKKKGTDRLAFIVPALASSIIQSASSNVWFLQNSITFYNVSCIWPWQLFLFIFIICSLIIFMSYLHIRNSIRDSSYVQRLVEVLFIFAFFLLPKVLHAQFHFHHYYSFWLLGMIFNRDEWWNQLIMAIAWGQFINGIGVYGADPVHTCAHALHTSISNNCLRVKADEEIIIDTMEKYGGEWIETILSSGLGDACFYKSAALAPDIANCTSGS